MTRKLIEIHYDLDLKARLHVYHYLYGELSQVINNSDILTLVKDLNTLAAGEILVIVLMHYLNICVKDEIANKT